MDPRNRSHQSHDRLPIHVLRAQLRVRESVRFDDNMVVQIEGQGVILFTGKGDEHRRLARVCYIQSFGKYHKSEPA